MIFLFLLAFFWTFVNAEDCVDKDEACLYVDTSLCFGQDKEWMMANCAQSCGFCKASSSTCTNVANNCNEVKNLCTTPEYFVWAKSNCRKFCGFCNGYSLNGFSTHSPLIEEGCRDKRHDCFWYDDTYCTGENKEWAQNNCPDRCGLCGKNTTCVDKITFCHKLNKDICTNSDYLSWARTNCRKFCNLCAGITTTAAPTTRTYYTDPADNDPKNGQWSFWDPWSECSATCGGGSKVRHRFCNNPPPLNGGDECVGEQQQTKLCNNFECPDCTRQCPWGGRLSKDCSVCTCSHSDLFGDVKDGFNNPVHGVDVFVNSRQWQSIATTNSWGEYFASGLCLMGQELVFKKTNYREQREFSMRFNATHWQCSATLIPLVAPRMQIQPDDKVRFEGGGAVICCKADGTPNPAKYTWIKDGKEIKGGENGELHFGNMNSSHSGLYSCRTETEAGVVNSRKAVIKVHTKGKDTCDKLPSEKWTDLPEGCFVNHNGIQNSSLNVGECRRGICVTSDLLDSTNCVDPWNRRCCDINRTEPIEVQCAGFSYTINRVVSCSCFECTTLTQISGVVYGYEKGMQIPFKNGEIYIHGKLAGVTSSTGYFSIRVDSDFQTVVLELKNDRDRKFMETIKTVQIIKDQNTPISIVVPLKPKTATFNANNGYTSSLGAGRGMSAVSYMSFPADSIVTKDGKPHKGLANIAIDFVDPRNLESLKGAYGSISTIDENGQESPLDTYGMVNYVMEDNHGNPLFINSPLIVHMDPTIFNVTVDEEGNTDLYSWHLDMGTGKWVKDSEFTRMKSTRTRRKLLQSVGSLYSTFPILPRIELTEIVINTTIKTFTHYYKRTYTYYTTNRYNVDKMVGSRMVRYWAYERRSHVSTKLLSEKHEKNFTIKTPHIKKDACVVRVQVYEDRSFTRPLVGATVNAYTFDDEAGKYSSMDTQPVNELGRACLKILCEQTITLTAEKTQDPKQLVASSKHSLPEGFSFNTTNKQTRVHFKAHELGYIQSTRKYSPVLDYEKLENCKQTRKDDYHFKFAALVLPPQFHPTVNKEITNKKLSWYPTPKDKITRRSCFIKVRLMTSDSVPQNMRFISKSYQYNNASKAANYGNVNVGPIPDYSMEPFNLNDRAACLEFRCPGTVHDGDELITEVPTRVEVYLTYNRTRCSLTVNTELISAIELPWSVTNGFIFHPRPDMNYGPVYGVYIFNGPTNIAENFCLSGRDTEPISDTMRIIDRTVAATFKCR